MICWNRDDGRVYKARVSLTGDAVETLGRRRPDGQPNMTVDEFHECDEALRKDPRVIEALAERGITDMDRVLIDTWAYGAHLVPEQHRGGRDRLGRRLVPQGARLEPVRQPGHRPALRRRPQPDGAARDRGHPPRRRAAARWASTSRTSSPASSSATTSSRSRSPSPRAPRSRSTATPLTLAEVVAARRLQPPRGPGAPHRRLRRPLGRPPPELRRDGRPLPRPDDRPLPPHGVRHRRVGPRLHDHVARARLRLPRRDHVPRRRHARHQGRAVHDPQRDLHPRGGRRDPLEARRRRRPAPRSRRARRLVRLLPRDGRQLRVPRLLAALPGRQHRVPRAGDRDHGHDQLRRGRASRPTARSSTSAPTRRSTSTSSSPGSTSTSTARPTPCT